MSPTYGAPNGPDNDEEFHKLVRDWRNVDLDEGENAAEFLAVLVCCVTGKATMVTEADIYDGDAAREIASQLTEKIRRAAAAAEKRKAAMS
jgi:hypothetical protein